MNKDLELWAYRYKDELLKHASDYENGVEAVLALQPEEMLLLIFEHLDVARNIDGYLVDCLLKSKEDKLPF